MPSAIERMLDAHLARIVNRIRRLRQFDVSDEVQCEKALQEGLEILRAVTLYRGLLKNAEETHVAAPHAETLRAGIAKAEYTLSNPLVSS